MRSAYTISQSMEGSDHAKGEESVGMSRGQVGGMVVSTFDARVYGIAILRELRWSHSAERSGAA
jgi:hypothetical protein